jgi:hypothetical protein
MDAVITAATGYTDADLQPFLKSLARACPEVKVFLIAYTRDLPRVKELQRKYPFIEPVYVPHKLDRGGRVYRWVAQHFINEEYSSSGSLWRFLGRYSLHIMLERYFIALELLRAHPNAFENVLLSDSRDVVFQQNPFTRIGQSLVSGLEETTIGCCVMNSDWIRHLYGSNVYNQMFNRRVVCAGITLGPAYQMEQYLVAMCAEIWKCLPKVALIAQYDQGIHNYLIYTDKVRLELTDNRAGIIATLHYENPSNIQTDGAGGVVTVQGKVPAIVHQYDRHRNLVSFVTERLANQEVIGHRGAH